MGGAMVKTLALAACLGLVALGAQAAERTRSSSANSGMIEKITPDNVTSTLDTIGLTYKAGTDPRGYPMIVVDNRRLPVAQFNVLFFGCNAKAECEDITLWSWYDLDQPVSDKAIFAWNNPFGKTRRWTTGYLDEQNDPALVLNINATGGIGEEALQILVNTYIEDLFDFKDAITSEKTSENETAPGTSNGIKAAALLPSDVLHMTGLIKAHGLGGYRLTKQTDVKR
jgi:hypothetical protein